MFLISSIYFNFFFFPQAVIGSVGGVELLYPILEQVHLPIRKRVEPNVANGNQGKLDKAKTEGGEQDNLSPSPIKESPTNTLDVAWWFDGKKFLLKNNS